MIAIAIASAHIISEPTIAFSNPPSPIRAAVCSLREDIEVDPADALHHQRPQDEDQRGDRGDQSRSRQASNEQPVDDGCGGNRGLNMSRLNISGC
jgi:hypothetical protein